MFYEKRTFSKIVVLKFGQDIKRRGAGMGKRKSNFFIKRGNLPLKAFVNISTFCFYLLCFVFCLLETVTLSLAI